LTYYSSDQALSVPGYEVYFTNLPANIKTNIGLILSEVENGLKEFYIPELMTIEGGGGLSKIKQSLSKAFLNNKWKKDAPLVRRSALQPKLAHSKVIADQNIGLDILWNNKDTSFDSHLAYYRERFRTRNVDLCVMITRGRSLQAELLRVYERFLRTMQPFDLNTLCAHITLSKSATKDCEKILNSTIIIKEQKIKDISKVLWSSKFGATTSHIDKLLPRIEQLSNEDCPFIVIGIGKERLQ